MNRDNKPNMDKVKIGGIVYEIEKKLIYREKQENGGTLSTRHAGLFLTTQLVNKSKIRRLFTKLRMVF